MPKKDRTKHYSKTKFVQELKQDANYRSLANIYDKALEIFEQASFELSEYVDKEYLKKDTEFLKKKENGTKENPS